MFDFNLAFPNVEFDLYVLIQFIINDCFMHRSRSILVEIRHKFQYYFYGKNNVINNASICCTRLFVIFVVLIVEIEEAAKL